MTTKHTPGPWKADDSGNVFGPGGRIVASCAGFAGARVENMANAALVVAAPELLAALETMMSDRFHMRSEHGIDPHIVEKHEDEARAAIAKARGTQ